jgi:hypothetical protein
MAMERISSVRITTDSATVAQNLGLLNELGGTWRGNGFNLIARPDGEGKANLYLQLNQTHESLQIERIGSSIPNRGFGQNDIDLFGLTYLQRISDANHGGALHIEPGIWVKIPDTTYPPDSAPPAQLIARMGTIPHGNSLLAEGIAERFDGPPVLKTPAAEYAGSKFPSFNSTPFGAATPPASPIINAAGSSEKLSTPAPPGFQEYDLLTPEGPANPRTPFGTAEPPLPAAIDGVAMQDVVNDPIILLQAVINRQVKNGHTFEGVVLNIATQANLTFLKTPNTKPTDPTVTVTLPNGSGGIENILFLEGGEPVGAKGPNADTALVYATFWIEKVKHASLPTFMQLQYAQMVVLNFPIFSLLHKVVPLGWPHISVATLRKSFS